MNVLITGAKGFLGTSLIKGLSGFPEINISTYSGDSQESLFCKLLEADFIFHLAGVNRPKSFESYMVDNVQLTADIVKFLELNQISTPIYFSSSIHTEIFTEYGVSKMAGEVLFKDLSESNGNLIFCHRLARVFGPGAKPNYNSVVATFCHGLANDLPITVSNRENLIELIFVDDWVELMRNILSNYNCELKLPTYYISVGNLFDTLYAFKICSDTYSDSINADLINKLLITYESY